MAAVQRTSEDDQFGSIELARRLHWLLSVATCNQRLNEPANSEDHEGSSKRVGKLRAESNPSFVLTVTMTFTDIHVYATS